MARLPLIQPLLKQFVSEVDKSILLAKESLSYHEFRSGRLRRLARNKYYLIVELSFLQVYLAWEDFLEQTFLRYMCGGRTSSGKSPRLYVKPKNLDHAYNIIKGKQPFIKWEIAKDVIERAELFFHNGEPFKNAIGSISVELEDMRKIRNRVAHRSQSARIQFEDLVRERLGRKPRNITPGSFLFTMETNSNQLFIDKYCESIKVAASLIVS